MDNLKKLIQLAKADGGKFFVIDDEGNPVLVIMDIAAYEKVLLKKLKAQPDVEEINKKITEAQVSEVDQHQQEQEDLKSEVIDSTFEFEPLRQELEEI
jgi:hypothetical protein